MFTGVLTTHDRVVEVNNDLQALLGQMDGDGARAELEHAYKELDRLHDCLRRESAARETVESSLSELRNGLYDAAAVRDANERALVAARKEIQDMKAALTRGVQECRLRSDECEDAKRKLTASETQCERLTEDKARLTEQLREAVDDIKVLRAEVGKLTTLRDQEVAKAEGLSKQVRQLEEQANQSRTHAASAIVLAEGLEAKVGQLDLCEKALTSMCNGVSEAIDAINRLDESIAKSNVSGSYPSLTDFIKLHASPEARTGISIERASSPSLRRVPKQYEVNVKDLDADRVKASPDHTSADEARLLLYKLAYTVETLQARVYDMIEGRHTGLKEAKHLQEDELASLHNDRETMLTLFEEEKKRMPLRYTMLEHEITDVALRTDRMTARAIQELDAIADGSGRGTLNGAFEAAVADNRVVVPPTDAAVPGERSVIPNPNALAQDELPDMDRATLYSDLEKEFKRLLELQKRLETDREENAKLRSFAASRKIDWERVNESRRQYEELIHEIKLMDEYNEKVKKENAYLSEVAKMHQAKAIENPREAARRREKLAQANAMNKIAFQEWKSQLLKKGA